MTSTAFNLDSLYDRPRGAVASIRRRLDRLRNIATFGTGPKVWLVIDGPIVDSAHFSAKRAKRNAQDLMAWHLRDPENGEDRAARVIVTWQRAHLWGGIFLATAEERATAEAISRVTRAADLEATANETLEAILARMNRDSETLEASPR